jgi:hypothetical protein
MGYDVFITYATDSLDTARHPLSDAQWQRLDTEDPTLVPSTTDYNDRRAQNGTIERFHPVLWTAHPDSPPLWLIDGAIETKSPDERTMIKMVELAFKLGARVLDEDGGTYTVSPSGELLHHPPE